MKLSLMCFKQEGTISTSDKSEKLVEQFTYISSNISSTENDVNIHPAKAWKAKD